jgi:hypothetical protein
MEVTVSYLTATPGSSGESMAQRTQVLLIDDLDGGAADETVTFGLDGGSYEIDLSGANARQLRDALADYVAHGRKSGAVRGTGRRRTVHRSQHDSTDVRTWARSHGYEVSDRGRIATDVMAAYDAAH